MTSKEALESVKQCCYEYLQEFQNIEQVKFIGSCFMQLEQDLERLEVLNKADKPYLELLTNNAKYQCENEMLSQENSVLKKAIEIIKNKKVNFGIFIVSQNAREYNKAITIKVNGKRWLRSNNCTLTQKEYELLKEVLGE